MKLAANLASHLGMTIEEVFERVSEREWRYWEARHAKDPFGEEREDWRNASLVQAVVSIICAFGGGSVPQVKDFMLNFDPAKAGKSRGERVERKLSAYIAARKECEKLEHGKHRQPGGEGDA